MHLKPLVHASARLAIALAGLLATLLAVTASAHAAEVAGGVDDRAGGVASPQQDLRSAAVIYDSSGRLRGAVVLSEAPTSAGVSGVGLNLGTWSRKRGWCQYKADVDLRPPDSQEEPFWTGGLYLGGTAAGLDPVITPLDATIRVDVAGGEIAARPWNCAWASTFGPRVSPRTDDFEINDESKVFSLSGEQAQNPESEPRCVAPRGRVRRGGKVALRCEHVSGPLTVRLYRGTKLKKTIRVKRGKVATRGLAKGRWRLLVWRGSDVVGEDVIKVR